jgi:hypothetical protein
MRENKLLSVESDDSHEIVELHMNRVGLDYLIDVLATLRESDAPDHVHIMSPEWGGDGLTGEPRHQREGYVAAKHMKVCLW